MTNKTQQLKSFLAQHKSTLAEKDYDDLIEETERLIVFWTDKLNAVSSGAERAKAAQDAVDRQNVMFEHVKTSCQNGCGYCCHLEVEITKDDADRLAEAVDTLNIYIDPIRMLDQASRARLDDAWKEGAVRKNRCVMLGENNSCRAYESRPATCRKHSVVSPVSECATIGGNPVPRVIPMNEIIISATINLPDNAYGSLSKMLMAALKRQEDARVLREPPDLGV